MNCCAMDKRRCTPRAVSGNDDKRIKFHCGTDRLFAPLISLRTIYAAAVLDIMGAIGHRRWAIAEGWIPSQSSFSDPALMSHETACMLNAGDETAHVRITVFYADREPVAYHVTIPPRRTLHQRFNDLNDPEPIPRDTAYSSVFESNVPIVVQHTRLDSRRPEVSLLSTIAYAEVVSA